MLWRDAMWEAVDPAERVRLVLELGRATLREQGRVTPQLVALVPSADPPVVVYDLPDVPSESHAPAVRQRAQLQLQEQGAQEAIVMVMVKSGEHDGAATFLLLAWGETSGGDESCWMSALRQRGDEFEEAPPVRAPDPRQTELSRLCRGLLPRVH